MEREVITLSKLVGSHQATLKELSRVRHELLKAKANAPKLQKSDAVISTPTKSKDRESFKPQVLSKVIVRGIFNDGSKMVFLILILVVNIIHGRKQVSRISFATFGRHSAVQ